MAKILYFAKCALFLFVLSDIGNRREKLFLEWWNGFMCDNFEHESLINWLREFLRGRYNYFNIKIKKFNKKIINPKWKLCFYIFKIKRINNVRNFIKLYGYIIASWT